MKLVKLSLFATFYAMAEETILPGDIEEQNDPCFSLDEEEKSAMTEEQKEIFISENPEYAEWRNIEN